MKELAQVCGFTDSTTSRTARSLATPGTRDWLPPGLGLLEIRRNPDDRRGRTLHLTELGRRMRDSIDDAIRSAEPIGARIAPPDAIANDADLDHRERRISDRT